MGIRVGIIGHGNLGRGVECALKHCPDMQLSAIFTRRPPKTVTPLTTGVPVYNMENMESFVNKLDVVILCGGSATDLPQQTPQMARLFNVVDSFDTHAAIPAHFNMVDAAAKSGGKVALISAGWDPGMFSLNRLYAQSVLPQGQSYTFWGKGVSQGHSDAIRRLEGVVDARQYTIPIEQALQAVRQGSAPTLTARQKHLRECFVVAKSGADTARIEKEIKEMPNYFAEYDTTVQFISLEELQKNHSGIPHGGFVIHSGKSGMQNENTHVIEYSLKLDSNPQFTSSVLVAYARAAVRMNAAQQNGCKTVFDVPPAYLSPQTSAELRQLLL